MSNLANLATSTVLTAPSPATSGTSLTLQAGEGARMPAVPFYATVHPDNKLPTFDNAEIVQVTAVSTDTLTIVRAQKSTTAQSIAANWRFTASIYTDSFVNGPTSSTDNAVVRFDSTTGKLIQDSSVLLDDSNNLSGIGNIALTGTVDGRDIATDGTKLDGIETGAEVNNISDANATDLTDGGETSLHSHANGDAHEISVTQTTHGLAVGDVVRSSGTDGQYTKAQADSEANAEVVGIVTVVTDANNFTMVTAGKVDVAAAVPNETAGTVLFLSPTTAGALTATEPTTDGQISKPVAVVTTANAEMQMLNMRGVEVSGGSDTESLLQAIYPVGAIFISGSSTMPSIISDLGTWARIEGRFIVGASDSDTDFDNGDTGGAKTHTLTVDEMPTHTHAFKTNHSGSVGYEQRLSGENAGGAGVTGGTLAEDTSFIDNKGGGSAHNNLPPYKAKYMWERTA